MTSAPRLPLDLLRCPRCKGVLVAGASIECTQCKTHFPQLQGVPWLFSEPQAALSEWRQRTRFLLAHLEQEAAQLRQELQNTQLRARTRSRLKLLAGAKEDQGRRLRALLAPLQLDAREPSMETQIALRTRLPDSQHLTSYYANVHRDWCWGDEENEASFAQVAAAFGEHTPGTMLVLGAGAGRLAVDLHQRCAPLQTIAADINPLLVFIGAKVIAGESASLYEFPIAPKTSEDHALLRRLTRSEKVRDGFHFVFADAFHAPFASGRFNSVVTPWFIDIVPHDLEALARRINDWLAPGGLWINFGSLAFSHPEKARCYALDEVMEILEETGFECTYDSEATIPYMRSPASRHSRVESVITFGARRVRSRPPASEASELPEWLIDGSKPIPLLPSFQTAAMSTRIHAFIMSLIDGRRSLRDVAAVLVEQRLLAPEDAEPSLRSFVIKMYEEARAPRPF